MKWLINSRGLVFDKDGDGAGGGQAGSSAGNSGGAGAQTSGSNDGKQGDPGQADQNAGKEKLVSMTEADLQKRIDDVVKERLEREKKKTEEATRKAREEAEAKALADQQKWQELAEKHAKRVTELEAQAAQLQPMQEQVERYKGALEKQLKSVKAGLPAHLTALLDKLDPVEQMEYIAANADAFKRPDGVPPSPDPAKAGQLSEEERQKALQQTTNHYTQSF